ncbi:unnamed protein product [Paramecium primaurelia]|uniref:Uncharacterized protein n=2 Tax=Paramecium TaxID=5884 RepID=A0A8S1XFB7_9CILI|nr:unnamed protein product [Paramecium primaurelia]CAD8199583.1 unnamed protein product [Paramecium pentaurelia]
MANVAFLDPMKNEPNLQTAQDVDDYINTLIQHQNACEKQGKYMEAEDARKRINELRKQLITKKKKELIINWQNQKDQAEKAHMEEYNQFNQFWDNKMVNFNEEAKQVEIELQNRQQNEYKQLQEELERTTPYKPKESSEILNLKKIEEHLAKQKNYVEAHTIQNKRAQLEEEELKLYSTQRILKIKTQLQQFEQRHLNELNALQQRIKAGQDELRKNRSIDLERLLQKYQNMKKDLEQREQMDILAFDGQFKTKGCSSQSTYKSVMMMAKK